MVRDWVGTWPAQGELSATVPERFHLDRSCPALDRTCQPRYGVGFGGGRKWRWQFWGILPSFSTEDGSRLSARGDRRWKSETRGLIVKLEIRRYIGGVTIYERIGWADVDTGVRNRRAIGDVPWLSVR